MADDLKGMKVSILATDGVERIELEQPRGALSGAGASSDLLSIHSGEIQASADLPAFCPAIVAQFAKASVPGWAPGGMR